MTDTGLRRGGDVDLYHHGDLDATAALLDVAVNVRLPGPPPWLHARLAAALADLGRYPDSTAARAAVARRHGRSPDEVLLTAGAAEAFVLLARTLRPRRAVCVHPSFTEPEAALRAAGHPVDRVVLPPPFHLDPTTIPADADLVILGNPTNPTSILHPPEVVAALTRPGRLLVVDEAFADCVPGEAGSLARNRTLPGLAVVRSLTKAWGLAGLRIGYLLAAPDVVRRLAAAQPLWPVSSPALVAAEACSSGQAVAEIDTWARDLAVRRASFAERLHHVGAEVVPGATASYLLVHVPDGASVLADLRAGGIAARRGDTFPGLGPDWLRVAVRDDPTNDHVAAGFAAVLHETEGSA